MKRKFICVIATLILIAVLVACLVGCVPSRPDKFIKKLLYVDSWGLIGYDIDGEVVSVVARDKNMVYTKGTKLIQYYIYSKTAVEIYIYREDKWTYNLITDESSVKKYNDAMVKTPIDVSDAIDLNYIADDFTNKFEKKGGKWIERSTDPATLYIKSGKMFYEKGDDIYAYVFDYDIKLPKEAKQAKADTINKG